MKSNGGWWKQATYGQSRYEFTVLRDRQTQDGVVARAT
jgi:hypothetical protein